MNIKKDYKKAVSVNSSSTAVGLSYPLIPVSN